MAGAGPDTVATFKIVPYYFFMARTADHEQRRRQVAHALLRSVGRQGLARTTLADVADEAGVSVGLVQSYFRTKSQLLRFGVEYMYKQGEARLLALAGGVEADERHVRQQPERAVREVGVHGEGRADVPGPHQRALAVVVFIGAPVVAACRKHDCIPQ